MEKNIFLETRIKGAEPRIVRLEKFGLKFSSSSFIIRVNLLYMGYWPGVRSRWLDIGQVPFLRFYEPKWIDTQKKNEAKHPAILTEQALLIKDLLYGINTKTW